MREVVYSVTVIDRPTGAERQVRVSAATAEHARELVASHGEIVGSARLAEIGPEVSPARPLAWLAESMEQKQQRAWLTRTIGVGVLKGSLYLLAISAAVGLVVGLVVGTLSIDSGGGVLLLLLLVIGIVPVVIFGARSLNPQADMGADRPPETPASDQSAQEPFWKVPPKP